MDRTLIVVLALVIAACLAGGVYLMLSGEEEPTLVGPVGGEDWVDESMGEPVPSVPAAPMPEPVVFPEPTPDPVAPPKPADEPAPPAAPVAPEIDEEAAIEKMKATLEGVTFSLEAEDLTVHAALDLIAALAGVTIDTNLADASKLATKVSFSFDSTGILDGLQFVCTMTGLKYEVGPKGIVIK